MQQLKGTSHVHIAFRRWGTKGCKGWRGFGWNWGKRQGSYPTMREWGAVTFCRLPMSQRRRAGEPWTQKWPRQAAGSVAVQDSEFFAQRRLRASNMVK